MKAIVVCEPGAEWQQEEIDLPVITDSQVLIRIHASGLCYSDIHISDGTLPVPFPVVPGHEPVGEIVEAGSGVTGYRVGDRVGAAALQSTCGRCEWCQSGRHMFCPEQVALGVSVQGAHAEYVAAEADSLVLLPDNLSYEQAAPVLCAGYTVWGGFCRAEPQPTDRVAVLGIGGLGHLAVQYAHACGHRVIAITHSRDKEALVRELGADKVVGSGEELMALGGADIVLATGNSTAAMGDAIQGLRPDGRFVAMGVDDQPLPIPMHLLFSRRIKVIGSQHNGMRYLREALDFVADGRVKVLTELYQMEDCTAAEQRIRQCQARFR